MNLRASLFSSKVVVYTYANFNETLAKSLHKDFGRILSDSPFTSGHWKSVCLAEHFCKDTSVLSML